MRIFLLFITIVILTAFKCSSVRNKEKENFDIVEIKVDSSCSLSLLYFYHGDYMYQIGTMDSCLNLTKEIYIKYYEILLEGNVDKILVRNGKILFEANFDIEGDTLFQQELISITNKILSTTCKVIEENFDRLTVIAK